MAAILIRNLDDRTKNRLRLRAAKHNRSMEDEARSILRDALGNETNESANLAKTIQARFQQLGGVEFALPVREPAREPPKPAR
jgi:plasmid stability protein